MARRGGAAAENLPVSYAPADFTPSRILPASKAVALSLIKVPKFVAEAWRSSPADATAGVLTEKNGKAEARSRRCAETQGLTACTHYFSFILPRALWLQTTLNGGGWSLFRGRRRNRSAGLDSDALKVKLFRLFEAAGAAGLQLKQIAAHTQQPLSYVKTLVEEIAEQRNRRLSDRKAVYFLKQQYSVYSSEQIELN
ncbi:LOW QUALITY PROTEIN: hypothetical protein, conserved [Eimeria necatrix]|uniref:Uncharacterized protein n=1 Tax=Eimeria necatrix TaxID=51315 RepID=U6N2G1_9EIME|nr:LOW QUALITY PROTEIN: hypothetical protein, conserved [Eimeria necatrix]CDJ70412.1 hypothetical protein, conserved [Eimeria necatrix]